MGKLKSIEQVYSYALETCQMDLSEFSIALDIVNTTQLIAASICDLSDSSQQEPLTQETVGAAMSQIIQKMDILKATLNHWDKRENDDPRSPLTAEEKQASKTRPTESPIFSEIRKIIREENKHSKPQDSPYMTAEEVGAYLRLGSHRTMEKWRSKGTGPVYRTIAGRNLYKRQDVIEWANSRK